MDAPVADAGLGVGVREQPCSRERQRRSLSRIRLVASAWILPKVASISASNAASVMLCWISRSASTWNASTLGGGQSERLAGVWTAELALRVWRIENDDSWLLWVFAHTTGTGVTRMRNALGAVVAVERSTVEVDAGRCRQP